MIGGPKIGERQDVLTTLPQDVGEAPAGIQTQITELPRTGVTRAVKGPVQRTEADRRLEVEAAFANATSSLTRLAAQVRGGVVFGKLVESIADVSRAVRAAVALPGFDPQADAREQNALLDALGVCLPELAQLVEQVADGDSSRMSQGVLRVLSVVYEDLLNPAEALFGPPVALAVASTPEGASAASVLAGRFIPIPEARRIVGETFEKFNQVKGQMKERGQGPMSRDAEVALFKAILQVERRGLFMSLDAGVFDDLLPEHLAKAITRDHHGIHSDPNRPAANTTSKFLDDVEDVLARGLSEEDAIARLQNRFSTCVTDNLADAVFPLFLAQCIPELVRKGGISVDMGPGRGPRLLSIEGLRTLALFEDFAFFGTDFIQEGKHESLDGEIVVRDIIHLVLANFAEFDAIIEEYKLPGSDRFTNQSAEIQSEIMARALKAVARNVADFGARMDRANGFKKDVGAIEKQIAASHDLLMNRLREHDVPAWAFRILEERVFGYIDNIRGGRFETWDVPALATPLPLTWAMIPFPPGTSGEERWGLVCSVPWGRENKALELLDTSMVEAFKPRLEMAIPRGGTLLFVFNPQTPAGTPEGVGRLLAEQLVDHDATHRYSMGRGDEPRGLAARGIFSPDVYLYDAGGDYVWTPGRKVEAHRLAMAEFERAVSDPACTSVVLMVGPAGAGKSTYLEAHTKAHADERGAVYFDSTLTEPEEREEILRIAKAAGKPVDAWLFATSEPVCLERNARRSSDRRVPHEIVTAQCRRVLEEPPRTDEGLRSISVVAH